MSDKKTSLSERMKAGWKEEKKPSLADRMKAKREEAEAQTPSLAERMKARQNESKTTSLADRMRERVAEDKPKTTSPVEITRRIEEAMKGHVEAVAAANLSEEDAATLKATIESQRETFQGFIRRVSLTDMVKDVQRTGETIEGLPEAIGKVRSRGYIFHSYLEDKVDVLATQWDSVQDTIDEWIEREAEALSDELDKAEGLFERIDKDPSVTVTDKGDSLRLGVLLEILEEKVSVAEERIGVLFESLKKETDTTARQVREIEAILAMKDEASFSFLAGENIFLVAKAEWDDGNDKPEGVLYLSDQRFVFEQKEKTGKTLGMFGGKQVHEVLWEAPVSLVEGVSSENKGFLGGKDMLTVQFASGAPYGEVTVELKGGVRSQLWETQIKRMTRGELESESITAPDEGFLERLREAPTDCPTCGATLPKVTGTPSQIDCLYCGTAIRI